MRYTVNGTVIRSENAAKPSTDAATYLVNWLHDRKRTHSALDYGCGKLRYTHHLARRSKHVGLVDSQLQLTRMQRILGRRTSIVEYAKTQWPSHTIQALPEFWRRPTRRYGFVLCANVLSTIPCEMVRARSLRAIRSALQSSGNALFVNQHTNSYFTKVRARPTTRVHLDGWIAESAAGATYYGILRKNAVVELVRSLGFVVEDAWVKGQSNYVLASKGNA